MIFVDAIRLSTEMWPFFNIYASVLSVEICLVFSCLVANAMELPSPAALYLDSSYLQNHTVKSRGRIF